MAEEYDAYQEAEDQALAEMAELDEESYVLIGRFIYEFSQAEHWLKLNLAARLNIPDDLYEVIIGWWDFQRTCDQFRAFLDIRPDKYTDTLREVIKNLSKLNDQRVVVAHALWEKATTGGLFAMKAGRGKQTKSIHFEDKETLQTAAGKARQISTQLLFLHPNPTENLL